MLHAPQSEYHHAKQGCYLCGTTGDLVDTQVFIEGEGVLAICSGCIKGDLLLTLGIDLKALEGAEAALDAAVTEATAARAEVRRLRKQIKDLKAPVPV